MRLLFTKNSKKLHIVSKLVKQLKCQLLLHPYKMYGCNNRRNKNIEMKFYMTCVYFANKKEKYIEHMVVSSLETTVRHFSNFNFYYFRDSTFRYGLLRNQYHFIALSHCGIERNLKFESTSPCIYMFIMFIHAFRS